MSQLRNEIIRLAHAKPELRKHLLPLLKEAAKGISENQMLDILDEKGYDTDSFEDDANLLREYAAEEGYQQKRDGKFYKQR